VKGQPTREHENFSKTLPREPQLVRKLVTGLKGTDVASGSPWQDPLTPSLETRPRVICKPTPFRGVYLTDPDDKPNPLEHIGLVQSIALARRDCARRRGLDLEDLVQSGYVGLMMACKQFRPELGYEFSTYATYWIKNLVIRALQNAHRPLRVPLPLLDLMSEVRREKVGRDRLTGGQKSRIADAERLLGSAVVRDPDVLAHLVADRHRDDDAGFARELLEILPAREREVIAAHFGVDGAGPLTLAAVGQRAGISRQEASALYRRGLERIRVRLGVELPRRDTRGAHSPCPGVFRMPSGRFWVRINIGDGKCARGGTYATLDEAKVAANRLAKVRLNIDGYTDRPRSTRRPR
jgi:RNA polymerase sigma factor (sigma-70 family)